MKTPKNVSSKRNIGPNSNNGPEANKGKAQTDEYAVGYGKPPKQHQFKPGQSGNPKGRKKGSRGLKTDLREAMNEKVSITENGKVRKISIQQLIIKSIATKAVKGDVKAAAHVLDLTMHIFGIEDEQKGKSALSPSDAAIVQDLLANNAGQSEPPADWPLDVEAANPENDKTAQADAEPLGGNAGAGSAIAGDASAHDVIVGGDDDDADDAADDPYDLDHDSLY